MSLMLLISIALALPAPSDLGADRDEGWRSDLDFLVEEARRVHADPERPAFSPHFQRRASEPRHPSVFGGRTLGYASMCNPRLGPLTFFPNPTRQ